MNFGGYSLGSELQVDYNFSDKLSNVSGLVYERFHSDEYRFLWNDDKSLHPLSAYTVSPSAYTLSAYSQFAYTPANTFRAVAGIRAVKDSDINAMFFSPRAGLIFSIRQKYFLKLLYGQAFRSPNFFEKYVSTHNVLFGSVDLDPEKIRTVDFGVEGHFKNIRTRLNGFITSTRDEITRVPTDKPLQHGERAAIYVNSTNLLLYGLEFSFNSFMHKKGYYGFNIGWKDGENEATNEDLHYFANVTSNAWFNYHLSESVSVIPSIQFVGRRKGTSIVSGDYKLDAYALLNANLQYRIKNIHLNFTVRNILDKDYSYPEYIRKSINDVPGGQGRAFTLSSNFTL
ncbi:MAG: TonB-dependent receptor domain-containing protein [bacterium]